MREAPPPRRTLVGLPGLLRPPGRELLDEHRPAHECRLRLHLDADQRAARRGAHPRRRGLRRVAQDLPGRGVPRVQGRPLGHPHRVLRSAAAAARGARRPAHQARRRRGLRGRRRHRHPHPPRRRAGPRGGHLHRRPRRLPARHRQGDPASTRCAGCPRCGAWTPPRSPRSTSCRPSATATSPRSSARPATTCPACPGSGPRRPRSGSASTATSPGSSPTSTRSRARPARTCASTSTACCATAGSTGSSTTSTCRCRSTTSSASPGTARRCTRSSTAWSSGCCASGCSQTFDVEKDEVEGGFELEGDVFTADDLAVRFGDGAVGRRVPHGVVVVRPLPRRQRRCRVPWRWRARTAPPPTSTSPR